VSLTARAIAIAILCAAVIAGWWRLTAYYDGRGYERRKQEDSKAAQEQTDRNRDLQRAAELKYTVQAGVREVFITNTVKEIRYDTQNLAACVLTPGAVRRLHDAAECAREDRPASCGADLPVRVPG
jgi:hypothetical protein